MPRAIMAQGIDSTDTNNLTRLVAQCEHMLHHKATKCNKERGTWPTEFLNSSLYLLNIITHF